MTRPILALLPLVLLVAGAQAQGSVVSPAHYAIEEGFSRNGIPFSQSVFPIRYQQAHGDLQGLPRTFRAIAFRRDGPLVSNTLFASRTLDMLVRCAHTSYPALAATFASNYATPPVVAMTRRNFVTPDLQPYTRVVPAFFTFVMPLDQPFAYSGNQDLLWETEVYAAVAGSGTSVPLDLCNSGFNLVIPGGYRMNGTGCMVPANSTNELQLRSSISLQGFPVDAWILAYNATAAPVSAAAAFMMGVTNPNLAVPGLCTNLYVLPLLTLNGTTDASGNWAPLGSILPSPRIPYYVGAVGAQFEAQVAVLDPARPDALKLSLSNGLTSSLPAQTPVVTIGRVSEIGTTTGTGTLATGTGLVTSLSY